MVFYVFSRDFGGDWKRMDESWLQGFSLLECTRVLRSGLNGGRVSGIFFLLTIFSAWSAPFSASYSISSIFYGIPWKYMSTVSPWGIIKSVLSFLSERYSCVSGCWSVCTSIGVSLYGTDIRADYTIMQTLRKPNPQFEKRFFILLLLLLSISANWHWVVPPHKSSLSLLSITYNPFHQQQAGGRVGLGAGAEKPRQRIGIAGRKVFAHVYTIGPKNK